ncbi:type II toxin-antitoxin system RelE/ParE family toxin [Maricaulis sp.]|uniref:type II toxin-antitoxin system RelE/ParE family toxin n=1 Tax=Maricaulis sp. TaxID=1486257 RepID=UPI003A95209D
MFNAWFDQIDAVAASRVTKSLTKLERGVGDCKGVGAGVSELRVDFGPGYRVYFGQDGETLVILLCGGSKKRQQADIDTAKSLWNDYKMRKRAKLTK